MRVIRFYAYSEAHVLLYLVEWADVRLSHEQYAAFCGDAHTVVGMIGGDRVVRYKKCAWILASSLTAPLERYPRWHVHHTDLGEERRIGMGTPILFAEADFPSE